MSNDIYNDRYWRYGVILQYENTKAIIREKYFENKITIELEGQYKREYLFGIRKIINEIHNDFNKLKIDEMVPCSCTHCKVVDQPAFYEFDLLRRYELKDISNIRCPFSLEEVNVISLTTDLIRGQLSNERLIVCENTNAELLSSLKLENIIFYPEKNSSGVFIQVKTSENKCGLRDRDFLIDSEIEKIKSKYTNYYILEYYCIENYLYHPDNIAELGISGFDKSIYIDEIVRQKNIQKLEIISIFKKARDSYQEFRIESEKLRIKVDEHKIFEYLESDDIEIFFKSYSMKDKFDKAILKKYQLKQSELAKTTWFKNRMKAIFV